VQKSEVQKFEVQKFEVWNFWAPCFRVSGFAATQVELARRFERRR
jgi:hypothetical protein